MASAAQLPEPLAATLLGAAREAFVLGLQLSSLIGAVGLAGTAVLVAFLLRSVPTTAEEESMRSESKRTVARRGASGLMTGAESPGSHDRKTDSNARKAVLRAAYTWVILTVVLAGAETKGDPGTLATGDWRGRRHPRRPRWPMPTSLEGHPADEDHIVVWRALAGAHDCPRPGAEAFQLVVGHGAEARVREQLT